MPSSRGSSQNILSTAILVALLAAGCKPTPPPPPAPSSTPTTADHSDQPPAKPQPVQPSATQPTPPAPVIHHEEHHAATPPPEGPVPETPLSARPPEQTAAPANNYALGNAVEAWKNSLLNGAIEYRVPTTMIAQQTSTVTVVIHGFRDTQTKNLPDATGTGTLKVSSQMKVELLAPLNPGEFTFAPQDTQPIQFIPNDGFATWIWNVTPADKADNQQLQIRVSLVYQGPSGNAEQIIQEKVFPISVNVQKLSLTVEQSFWKNPIAWFQYMLPGGAGWGALAALATFIAGLGWWKTKRKKKTNRKPPAKHSE